MARDYAKISTSLWGSKKFRALKGDRPRLLYFYFHTCAQVTSAGCFRIPVGYIVADLGWGANQVSEAMDSLCEAYLIDWNESEEVVRVIGFLDHDPPTNPKHAGAIARTAQALPDCKQKVAAIKDLLKNKHTLAVEGLREELDRLRIAYPEAIETPYPFSLPPIPTPPSLRSGVRAQGASRLKVPEDWPSKHDRENALAYWHEAGRDDLAPNLEAEVTKARAHHLGKGTRSPDWSQVWVTWYTRALEYSRVPRQSNQFPNAKIHRVV